jgi:hypothetical protein
LLVAEVAEQIKVTLVLVAEAAQVDFGLEL